MAVRAGYVDSEVTSQSEDERGINYVVRGPLNYNEFQVKNYSFYFWMLSILSELKFASLNINFTLHFKNVFILSDYSYSALLILLYIHITKFM